MKKTLKYQTKVIKVCWHNPRKFIYIYILLDFSLTVKAATLRFISGCGSAISSAMEGKCLSVAGPTMAQLEAFFSSDYL